MNSKELINQRRAWYKTIKSVYCPALKEKIIFNSKGFYHLRYNGLGHKRLEEDYLLRLSLLPLVIPVIKQSLDIYQTKERYEKAAGRFVIYWALRVSKSANGAPVTVVLRKVGNGQICFYSVIKK